MAKNFYEIYELLEAHFKREKGQMIEKNKLRDYFESRYRRETKEVSAEDREIRDIIKKAMIENKNLSKQIKDSLPEINAEKKAYLKKLREDAHKSADAAKNKAEKNQINAEKKLAKQELERIRQARIKNQMKVN